MSEKPPTFLTQEQAAEVREQFGTPCYVYDRQSLESMARAALDFPAPFGFTLRYAMKANPSIGILTLFRELGLQIDASSDYEVERAIRAGYEPAQIQLTSQMPSRRLEEHISRGCPVQRLLAASARGVRQARARRQPLVRLEPGPRERRHQPHQYGRAGLQLRDLA